jgi:DNA-binding NtrC family response regulator
MGRAATDLNGPECEEDRVPLTELEQLGKAVARATRPLRIVLVNDEPLVLQVFDVNVRSWFKDVTVLMFDNAIDALDELSRTAPDLLITYDLMPRMSGDELCQRLLDKRVTYPVIVFSAHDRTEKWVPELGRGGLNVSSLPCPFTVEDLRKTLEVSLINRIRSLCGCGTPGLSPH